MMQAAKEFESELKTEPEETVADSSTVAMSNKAEEKTEVSSSSKENVWRMMNETLGFGLFFSCSYKGLWNEFRSNTLCWKKQSSLPVRIGSMVFESVSSSSQEGRITCKKSTENTK